jgi:DNA polymerase I-like protein with 3'-5' exonuclease and polymerase domains
VHDEVILEGPEEHKEAAKQLVQQHMANPWVTTLTAAWASPNKQPQQRSHGPSDQDVSSSGVSSSAQAGKQEVEEGGEAPLQPLLVELATDCNYATTWYEAK